MVPRYAKLDTLIEIQASCSHVVWIHCMLLIPRYTEIRLVAREMEV